MRLPLSLALALLAPIAASAQETSPGSTPDSVKGITAKELGGHMRFLASDLMKGRDTGSAEIRVASEYLASRLFAAGAEPAGDAAPGGKSYFQNFPLEYVTAKPEGSAMTLIIERDGARQVLPCTMGTDYSFFPRGVATGEIEAPVVFGGQDRAGEEEMKDFAALELKNRFVMIYGGGGGFGRGRGRGNGGAPTSKTAEALQKGALGILNVSPPGSPSAPRGRGLGAFFGRPMMSLGATPVAPPTLVLADNIRDEIFRAVGAPKGPEKPGKLEGVRIKFSFSATKEVKQERNVVGLFPGSDPEKKKEVIIFSAHYDHVGVDEKGEIFNGSDDNASGTSALLEIAEAVGEGPRPARSIAFLWVSGEEKGLLGSSWFSDHVTLPEGYKIVADINLDMVSRNDGKQVGITPSPKHGDYSTLIPAAQETCKAEGIEALFNADEFYGRTDSYNFARKGIPVIFFFSGVHVDYHKPTDDVEKADFEKAARIARAAYRLGYQMAQAPEAPKKIKPPKEGEAGAKTNAAGAP